MTESIQGKKKAFNIKRAFFIIAFIILPVINFLVFYVYVNANSFIMGFQKTVDGTTVFTLEHFDRFFKEFSSETSEIRLALINTLKTFLIVEIMFPIGFLVSYFLYKKIPLYNVFRIIFFLPTLIAGTVITSVYMQIIGVEGPIAELVKNIYNLDYVPTLIADERFANTFVFVQLIWLSFPGNMILWGGTLSRIPESVLESAKLDGVNWWQEAFRIIVPIVWPTFSLLFLLAFVGLFGSTGNVFLLTKGDYGTQTISNWMYLQVYNTTGSANMSNIYNYMSAVGLFLTAVTLVLSVLVRKITGRFNSEIEY